MLTINKYCNKDNTESFSVKFNPKTVARLKKEELRWNQYIKKGLPVLKDAAYTISPHTCDFIKKELYPIARREFEKVSGVLVEEIDKKVVAVLYKPIVWDTYFFISRNADLILPFLKQRYEKKKFLNLRWICTGAAVAERTLLTRLIQNGIKDLRGVSTDISATAILISAINLELMNIVLDSNLDIRIVFKGIPSEFREMKNTIVLQIDDALFSLSEEASTLEQNLKYDAFLADNALPYFKREEGKKILEKALKITEDESIFQSFGINIGKLVELPLLTKLKAILNKNIVDETEKILYEIESKNNISFPNEYRHKFSYNRKGVIDKIVTRGSAEIYSFMGTLLRAFRFGEFLLFYKMISLATGLSKWSKISLTNTVETFQDLKNLAVRYDNEIIDYPGEENQWQDMIQSSFTIKVKK